MIILTIALTLIGILMIYYGVWFTFVTIANVLTKGAYVPFILIMASLLFSIGATLLVLGCKL